MNIDLDRSLAETTFGDRISHVGHREGTQKSIRTSSLFLTEVSIPPDPIYNEDIIYQSMAENDFGERIIYF